MSDQLDVSAVKLASLVAEICVESSSKGLLKKTGDLLPQVVDLDGFLILAEVENTELPIICSGGNTPKTIVFNESAFSEDILYGKPSILSMLSLSGRNWSPWDRFHVFACCPTPFNAQGPRLGAISK